MKISKKGQYALISMVDLAIHSADGHESIINIAGRQNIDFRYLGQVFYVLKNAGVISSVRGKNGGYYLCKSPGQITAGEVVRAIEGDLAPTKCCSKEEPRDNCKVYDSCITRSLWQTIAFEINNTLDNITIADLIEKYEKGAQR